MKRRLPFSALVIASVAAGTGAILAVGRLLWDLETARGVARLRARHEAAAPAFSRDELTGLPEPVVRFFEFALTPGQPIVRYARLEQVGEFAMHAGSWSPFTAIEYFSVDPPGFLWDAKIQMAPLASIYIRDRYVTGVGAMYGTLAALVPIVNQRATPVMASGELLRYLAEAALLPTALLPRNGISWQPLEGNSARVTLRDGPTTVSCAVDFGSRGEIERISAMRYRAVGAKSELTPWVGHFSDYRRVDGMMIPMAAEVEWVLPEGPSPYFRGRIVSARYEFLR